MTMRLCMALLSGVLLCACGNDPTVNPSATQLRLDGTISPSPLTAPTTAGDVFYNVELRASSRGSILLDQGDIRLLSATGLKVGQTLEIWTASPNCPTCTPEVRIPAGTSQRWTGKHALYVGGEAPTRLVYTLTYFSDDQGPGSLTLEVPIR